MKPSKNPICSIEHFKKLQKFFKKIATKQILENDYLKKNKLNQLFLSHFIDEQLVLFETKLLNVFKGHQCKTHSCFIDEYDTTRNQVALPLDEKIKMYVSYTVENESFRRCNVSSDSYIAFRIYMKVGNNKKRRISRCRVKLSWIPVEIKCTTLPV